MKIKSGFTIIEVLVAVAIVSVIFTSLISIAAISLRNSNINIRKTVGAHMADGLQEWIKGEKEDDWETFIGKTGTWCFNEPLITDWPSEGECDHDGFGSINNFNYKRSVTITNNGDVYKSKVTFYWDETNLNNTVVNETYYSQW